MSEVLRDFPEVCGTLLDTLTLAINLLTFTALCILYIKNKTKNKKEEDSRKKSGTTKALFLS
jgi:hypothetical protein